MRQPLLIRWKIGIQQFGFIGKPRFTQAIELAITQKTQAITEAERARNQLAVTQAEVAKSVAEAEGEARSQIERARGEAESNRLRQASITPQLLELKRLEREMEWQRSADGCGRQDRHDATNAL